ncbi:MAG: DUF499 domain-containing protein, partial [Candidatus Rokuibacteriota bacterium]
LIATDEAEVSEVVRRRLFETIGRDSVIRTVAKQYADWCFERRAQLPPEWTAVDTAVTEAKARDFLRGRFEACYPFHPATLSVFQRKWQGLPQYQQTRGTLAMFAQWISWAYRDGYQRARREPLITLGSAPLGVPEFRAVVLGQLGEPRLAAAIETDLVGDMSHAKALDADPKGALKSIHRRVGLAMLFESSGGMVDKVAHLPELRFAIGEPEVETTSVDSAASALEARGYYLRKLGSDGYRFGFQPTLKKVVNDRKAGLEESEVTRAMRAVARKEFERGASLPVLFTADGSEVADAGRLTLVVLDPERPWEPEGAAGERVRAWVRQRGEALRLTPGALIWCARRPGRDLRDRVELWLAWQRVQSDLAEGLLGTEFDPQERAAIAARVRDAEGEARGEVWAEYRLVILADPGAPDGITVLDLGPGHPHGAETLCGRVVTTLRSQNYLNESVGAGYIERKWPPVFKDSGAWPLSGLRQAFLNGSLTRLLDTDVVLKGKIVQFVQNGDFGLASGERVGGGFSRLWLNEPISADEVVFDGQTYLLLPSVAKAFKAAPTVPPTTDATMDTAAPSGTATVTPTAPTVTPSPGIRRIRLHGSIPPEVWNRVGNRLLPKLRTGMSLDVSVGFEIEVDAATADHLVGEIRQILADLSLSDRIRIE